MIFNEKTKLGQLFEDEECALDCIYYVTRKLDMTDDQESECLNYTIYDIAEMEGMDAEKLAKKIQKYYKKNADDFIEKIEFVSILDKDDYDEDDDDEEEQIVPVSDNNAAVQSEVKSEESAEPSDEIVVQAAEVQDKAEEPEAVIEQPEIIAEQPESKQEPSAPQQESTPQQPKQPVVQPALASAENLSPDEVLTRVKDALAEAGYDPYKQLAQYFVTKDATYITSKGNARNLIRSADTHSLIEALIKKYFK